MTVHTENEALFQRASRCLAGGVLSNFKKAKGVAPVYVKSAEGCRMTDYDGNVYYDFSLSAGPAILGHSNEGAAPGPQGAAGPGLHEPGLSGGHRSRGKDPAGGPLRRAGPLRRLRRGRGLQRHPGGPGLYRTPPVCKVQGGSTTGAWTSFWAAAPTAAIFRPGTAWTRTTSTPPCATPRGRAPHALDDCLLAEYNDLEGLAALFQQQGGSDRLRHHGARDPEYDRLHA